ncbi:MAG: HDOD domain-containing protein [Gammaproteobacteria bacterium]|nr:HDOD domain-containing protein [Gammaproteobacteria bacterium]
MDIYVGRQPIYNNQLDLVGYELLFRNNRNNQAVFNDPNEATSDVIINSCLEIGLNRLVGDRLAYINITRDFIVNRDELLLPKNNIVLEILEDIKCDDEVLTGLKDLKKKGYTIALDDFILNNDNEKFLLYADIIKLDIHDYDEQSLANAVTKIKQYNKKILAEKIENKDEYDVCVKLGFDQFQGYFLSKPQIIQGKKIAHNKLNLLRLLASLQNPNVTVFDQEEIISHDVALSYSLLRYINSSAFYLPKKIESIRQAVILLGHQNIKKWATMLSLGRLNDCPTPLLLTSVIRARMCELLASELKYSQQNSCFTAGLFSALDAIMSTNMEEIITHLPLSQEITLALLTKEGAIGNILKLSLAWEENNWHEQHIPTIAINKARMQELYLDAIEFGESTLSELSQAA